MSTHAVASTDPAGPATDLQPLTIPGGAPGGTPSHTSGTGPSPDLPQTPEPGVTPTPAPDSSAPTPSRQPERARADLAEQLRHDIPGPQ